MALGGATKKLQQIVDMAEETYERLNELREQVHQMRRTVIDTNRRVRNLERTVDDQRALIEALARDADVDVKQVLAEAAIEEAEPVETAPPDARAEGETGTEATGNTADEDDVVEAEEGHDSS
jgi:septal ring factor EnvC (AmiA/AmiB activator)